MALAIGEAIAELAVPAIAGAFAGKAANAIFPETSAKPMRRSIKSHHLSRSARRTATIRAKQALLRRALASASRPGLRVGFGSATEAKVFDTSIQDTVSASSGSWDGTEVSCTTRVANGSAVAYTESCLVPTGTGSAGDTVLGTKYHLRGIRVRGIVQPPTKSDLGDVPVSDVAILMLVMDLQPNGQQAQAEDVMRDIGTNSSVMYSFPRMEARSRFRILRRKQIIFPNVAVGNDQASGASTLSACAQSVNFDFKWFPKKPKRVQISATGGSQAVSKTVNCNIFLILNCPSASAPTIVAASRCYFRD